MTDTTKERAQFDKWQDEIVGTEAWAFGSKLEVSEMAWMARAKQAEEQQTRAMKVAIDYGERVASTEQSTETPPASDIEQLAVDLCRELYDRFMMGGWSPEDAHAETVLRLQQWAEAPRPVGTQTE